MESFYLNKLNKVEGEEQFRVEVSNKFAALEDCDTEVEINSAWEMIGLAQDRNRWRALVNSVLNLQVP
jgi:hypothetical protein